MTEKFLFLDREVRLFNRFGNSVERSPFGSIIQGGLIATQGPEDTVSLKLEETEIPFVRLLKIQGDVVKNMWVPVSDLPGYWGKKTG